MVAIRIMVMAAIFLIDAVADGDDACASCFLALLACLSCLGGFHVVLVAR